ncbi:MAG: hypothetical protein J7K36_06880, partial [Archaeoglobaceae archaeon]|nr:hypothetical protein [Archaeoglobaceae archaeon]
MPPPFIGVAGATESKNAAPNGSSFLKEEAGVCAYTKLTPPVNLTIVKTVFKTVEYECEDYIIGSVAVSKYETDDVHVYVTKDGWLVAYYFKEEPFPKIIKYTINFFEDNKLKDALKKVCDALWVSLPTVNYYDFRYPNANKVLIIADDDSFRFKIPREIALNVVKMYWVLFDRTYYYTAYIKLNDKTVGETEGKNFGELTFASPGVPGNIVPGEYYTVSFGGGGEGGIII